MNALLVSGWTPLSRMVCAFILCAPLPLLMGADLLADPRSEVLQLLSRCFYLSALVVACLVFLAHTRIPGKVFVLILAAFLLKLLDTSEIFRGLYLSVVILIFACAGYCAFTYSRRYIDYLLLGLLFLSAAFALLQVLGIAEWPYLFSRHGYFDDGSSAPLTITSTLLRGSEQLTELSLYQARPSAIFSSNQFYTGFLLLAGATALALRGRSGCVAAILLGLNVALSSSKAALLGLPILALMALIFIRPARAQACKVLAAIFFMVFAYAQLFPGLVSASLNYGGLMASILTRVLDLITAISETLGIQSGQGDIATRILLDVDQTLAESASYGVSESAGLGWKILGEVNHAIDQSATNGISESTGGGWASREDIRPVAGESSSLVAEAIRYPLQSALVGTLALAVTLRSGKFGPKLHLQLDLLILFSCLLFGLISNPGASLLYWYWVGFSCRFVWGKGFCFRPSNLLSINYLKLPMRGSRNSAL